MFSTSFSTGRNRGNVLLVAVLLLCAPLRAQETARDPDRLYADREHLQSALDAAAVWESRVKTNPKDFESAWKLARTCYWLGGHVAEDARRAQYERGIEAGRQASVLQSARPEGYFWMAANMGAMAESFGLRAGIKYRTPVRKALETVLMLDPGFQEGSADRALGRWYVKVPRLFDSYLRIGAKVCGPPAIDRLFKTIDFLVILDSQNIDARTRRMFLGSP